MAQEDANQKSTLHFYEDTKWRLLSYLFWIGLVLLLMMLTTAGGLGIPGFGNPRNIQNIFQIWLITALMVPPMILVMASGGLDLSVGAMVGFISVIVATLVTTREMSGFAAMLVGLGLAFLIGLVNGLLVGLTKLHSTVVTLGMMTLLRGLALTISDGTTVIVKEVDFSSGLKILATLLMILLTLFVIGLAEFTPLGRKRYSDLTESESWIRRLARTVLVYVLSGTIAGFSGILVMARVQAGLPTLGTGYEVQTILAVFLGGIPIGGGLLNVIGAMLGSLLIALTQNIAVMNNVPAFATYVYQGIGLMTFGSLTQVYTLVADWLFKSRSPKDVTDASPLPAD